MKINEETLVKLIEEINKGNSNLLVLIAILVSIPVIIEIIKFFTQRGLSNHNKKNNKRLLIDKIKIELLEKLYKKLDHLTLFGKGEEDQLLKNLQEVNTFITEHKLYIEKKQLKATTNLTDYFNQVLTDYRKKDIGEESKLFDKYCKEFNK